LTQGAIYIVRDPRDVAVSYAKHYGYDLDKAVDHLTNPGTMILNRGCAAYHWTSSWANNVASWCRPWPFRVKVLRYEDMRKNPYREFQKVVGFLSTDRSKARLRHAIFNSKLEVLRSEEKRRGFRERVAGQERFFGQGEAGGWKSVLSRDQARRIEDHGGEIMQRFGYATEN